MVTNINQKILIVADDGVENEAITRLARVGYDNVVGYLKGGFDAWKNSGKEVNTITDETAEEFANAVNSGANVLDVRKKSENFSEHVLNAVNEPLDTLVDGFVNLDKTKKYHIHCAGGYRSVIALSILLSKGFKSENLINVLGGFGAIKKESGVEVSEYVCPSTML